MYEEKVTVSIVQRIIIKFLTFENLKPYEMLQRLMVHFGENREQSWSG